MSRPDKLAVHVFEVDEDVDKDEVSLCLITDDNDIHLQCLWHICVILFLDCIFTQDCLLY